MREKPRLIIWDLDETFWRGTLTEGGIELIPEHGELVRHLAARGIVSSICSKNDEAPVRDVLQAAGLWDYFVFPSINWESKGPRIAAIIEAMGLRAPTVLFIDDNPQNLREAEHFAPGLQIAGPEIIATIREDKDFAGKDDSGMTRLKQYQLLQTRHADAQKAGGDNTEFLRASGIRVHIEYDVAPHIDRAIELINRTNQLNYTKRRLPEDIEEARHILRETLAQHGIQAGLIRVIDKYGDYGFVGFYMMRNFRREYIAGQSSQSLVHYCFSCRTLGMLVEQWLYEHLGRPELQVVGNVLTDLSAERRIDWITLAAGDAQADIADQILAPEIRVYGGCALNAVAHYLASCAPQVVVEANFAASGLFVRRNSVRLLRSGSELEPGAVSVEAARLGLPGELMPVRFQRPAPQGTIFVFEGARDALGWRGYRHKSLGWEVLLEPTVAPHFDFLSGDAAALAERVTAVAAADDALRQTLTSAARVLRDDYISVEHLPDEHLVDDLRWLYGCIPDGSLLIVVLNAETQRAPDGSLKPIPWIRRYNRIVEACAASYPSVGIIKYDDVIQDDSERHGANHYDRMAHYRLAQALRQRVDELRQQKPENAELGSGHPDESFLVWARGELAALRKGTDGAAEEAFLRAVHRLCPLEYWPLAELCRNLGARAEWTRLRSLAAELIERHPQHAEGHRSLALSALHTGDLSSARAAINSAAPHFEYAVWLAALRASLTDAENKPTEAAEMAAELLLTEEADTGYRIIARSLRKLARYDELERHLDAAGAACVDSSWIRRERCELAFALGRWEDVLLHVEACRGESALDPALELMAVRALRAMGRFLEARAAATLLLAYSPNIPAHYVEAAKVAADEADWPRAHSLWAEYRSRFPTDMIGYIEGAAAYDSAGDQIGATKLLQDAKEKFPDRSIFWNREAYYAQRRGDWQEADRLWQAALEKFPSDIVARSGWACLPALLPVNDRNVDQALTRLKTLSDDDRLQPLARRETLRVLREASRLQEADLTARSLRETAPNDPDLLLEHAEIAKALGDVAGAVSFASDAVAQPEVSQRVVEAGLRLLVGAKHNLGHTDMLCLNAISRFPRSVQLHRIYAWSASQQSNPLLALQRLMTAAKVFPTDAGLRQETVNLLNRLDKNPRKPVPQPRNIVAASQRGQRRATPPARRSNLPAIVSGKGAAAAAATAGFPLTPESCQDLALRFESLGGNGLGCEFGFIQRRFGAEPLGLLRWATSRPDQLALALRHRFEGVGTREQTILETYEGGREYRLVDARFGFVMHTHLRTSQVEASEAMRLATMRMSYLKRKMMETLSAADKILVYKAGATGMTEAQMQRILDESLAHGPNRILCVMASDADNPPGSVRLLNQNLAIGYVTYFGALVEHGEPVLDVPSWLRVCMETVEVFKPGRVSTSDLAA